MFRKLGLVLAFAVLCTGFFFAGDAENASAQSTAPKPTATPSATPPPIVDDEVLKIDTEVVNVLFTAQDRNRRLLTSLTQSDIRLLEDGVPQELSAFTRQVDLPLSLSILIDVSVSQQRTLPDEKDAAISFLESVVRPSKDEVAVLSFTGETTLEQDMTNNLTRLRRAIENVKFVPPSGYIGGGVVVGGSVPGTPPISGRNQGIQGSTAIWDAIIYSVGIGDSFYGGVDKGTLNKVSERTGGRAFFPRDENELRQAFKQIEEEMRSQYLLAYEPSNQNRDGSFRKIEIQLVNPALKDQKIKLTHRQGYFAKSDNKK
ncbi:MAG: VWA domain-containing protein [Acidobacteria bacterium ACB1]|nr:VWA domain-containing protein [Acidobacteria bacterium ACB1]